MLKKLILVAASLTAGLAIAAPALADGGHRHHRNKSAHHWKYHSHARPVVVMPPPRVYYAPPPRVYYAPPPRVYYAPAPRPVYQAPAPHGGISIRLHFPL